MKRLTVICLIATALMLGACGTTPTPPPDVDPTVASKPIALTPELLALIETVRPIGRLAAQVALTSRGVPAPAAAAIVATAKPIIDTLLTGEKLPPLSDSAAWKVLRDDLVRQAVAAMLAGTKNSAIPIDVTTANDVATALIDGTVAQIRLLVARRGK